MSIPFQCPHCGHRGQAPDQFAGQSGPCVQCGGMVTIPGRSDGGVRNDATDAVVLAAQSDPSLKRLLITLAIVSVVIVGCTGVISKIISIMMAIALEETRAHECQANLQRIGEALEAYHDEYGTLPPAYVADANGKPQHSWRVLILPFLDEEDLYKQYDFKQPWDSAANRKLASQMPPVYACPARSDEHWYHTNYLALVDPKSAFPGATGVDVKKIADGTTFTMIVAEAKEPVDWLSPVDFVVPAVQAEAEEKAESIDDWGLGSEHLSGINVLYADGHAATLTEDELTPENLRPQITINAGD